MTIIPKLIDGSIRFASSLTKTPSSDLRRLDTIARFLELGNTCVALSFFGNEILLSSNKMKFSGIEYVHLEYDESVVSIKKSLKDLTSAQKSGNRACEEKFYDFVMGGLIPATSKKHKKTSTKENNPTILLEKWAAKIDILHGTKLEQALEVLGDKPLRKDVYKISYRHHVEYIIEMMHKYNNYFENESQNKIISIICKDLENMHNRAKQDAKKLTHLIFSRDFTGLSKILLSQEGLKFISPPSIPDDKKDHHAEMNLLSYIEDYSGSAQEIYIGISKKSCYGCELDIKFVNSISKSFYKIRGCHGREYDSRMDTRWSKDAREELEHKTKKALHGLLFAELSESEIELVGQDHEDFYDDCGRT